MLSMLVDNDRVGAAQDYGRISIQHFDTAVNELRCVRIIMRGPLEVLGIR